jgi:hypothetical protein
MHVVAVVSVWTSPCGLIEKSGLIRRFFALDSSVVRREFRIWPSTSTALPFLDVKRANEIVVPSA